MTSLRWATLSEETERGKVRAEWSPVLGSWALSQLRPPFSCSFLGAGFSLGSGQQEAVMVNLRDLMIRTSSGAHGDHKEVWNKVAPMEQGTLELCSEDPDSTLHLLDLKPALPLLVCPPLYNGHDAGDTSLLALLCGV